jgi:hypothetical protein
MMSSRCLSSFARTACRVLGRLAIACVVLAPAFAIGQTTFQDFSADFPPPPPPTPLTLTGSATLAPGTLTGDPSVSYLQLTQNANGLSGSAGLGQVLSNTGAYESLIFDFDFRMDDPATGADGFGFQYLPVSSFGVSGPAPALHEEPNFAGGFGIGFDSWNNDDATDGTDVGLSPGDGSTPDSLSLHFNGARLASVSMLNPAVGPGGPLPPAWLENNTTKHATITVVPDAGAGGSFVHLLVTEPSSTLVAEPFGAGGMLVTGLSPYDGRVGFSGRTGNENQEEAIDNLTSTFDPAGPDPPFTTLINNFDSAAPPPPPQPTILGGTPFAARQHGGPPPGTIVPTFPPIPPGGGPAEGHYQLTDNTGGILNSIAFDKTFGTLADGHQIIGSFDIRVVNTNVNTADGMSFMLADTTLYGETGPIGGSPNVSEDPNNPGMVALGFDTFDNNEDFLAGDPTGCGPQDPPAVGSGPCIDRRANSISVHNGAQVDQQFLAGVTYNDGNWIRVDFALTAVDNGTGGLNGLLDVVVTDLTTGATFPAFGGLGVGTLPTDLRVAFGARTGGEFDFQLLDNVNITHIPEPSTYALACVAAAGLYLVRRRRK